AAPHVQLVRARDARRGGPLLGARQLHVAGGGLQRLEVGGGQRAQAVEELALCDREGVEGAPLDLVPPQLEEARLDDQVRAGPLDLAEERDIGADRKSTR